MLINQIFVSSCENCIDPDQLASKKPADQDPHCFLLGLYMTITGKLQDSYVEKVDECST